MDLFPRLAGRAPGVAVRPQGAPTPTPASATPAPPDPSMSHAPARPVAVCKAAGARSPAGRCGLASRPFPAAPRQRPSGFRPTSRPLPFACHPICHPTFHSLPPSSGGSHARVVMARPLGKARRCPLPSRVPLFPAGDGQRGGLQPRARAQGHPARCAFRQAGRGVRETGRTRQPQGDGPTGVPFPAPRSQPPRGGRLGRRPFVCRRASRPLLPPPGGSHGPGGTASAWRGAVRRPLLWSPEPVLPAGKGRGERGHLKTGQPHGGGRASQAGPKSPPTLWRPDPSPSGGRPAPGAMAPAGGEAALRRPFPAPRSQPLRGVRLGRRPFVCRRASPRASCPLLPPFPPLRFGRRMLRRSPAASAPLPRESTPRAEGRLRAQPSARCSVWCPARGGAPFRLRAEDGSSGDILARTHAGAPFCPRAGDGRRSRRHGHVCWPYAHGQGPAGRGWRPEPGRGAAAVSAQSPIAPLRPGAGGGAAPRPRRAPRAPLSPPAGGAP